MNIPTALVIAATIIGGGLVFLGAKVVEASEQMRCSGLLASPHGSQWLLGFVATETRRLDALLAGQSADARNDYADYLNAAGCKLGRRA